jgi:pimeloyl-ACP methyl ester carboxylesterase
VAVMTKHVRSADGTAIAIERAGEGPTIVFVDGAIAHRAINPSAAQLTELLAPQFTVLAYDRRGRGESGNTEPYAVEREIEDLEAVIAESGGPAFVVGGSSGAVLALDAAAQGLPIGKLAVYEPPFIVDDTRPPLPDDYVEQLDRRVEAGRPGDAVELFMTAAMRIPAEFVAGMKADESWSALEQVGHTIAYDGRIMGTTMSGKPLPEDRWSAVAIPTLVLDGGDSPPFMHNGADALAGVLPNAERRTLEGQTHEVEPQVLAPVLVEFFERDS